MISEWVGLDQITIIGRIDLRRQCRTRSDTAECGIFSVFILFATHPAILHIFTGSETGLLKRSIGQR